MCVQCVQCVLCVLRVHTLHTVQTVYIVHTVHSVHTVHTVHTVHIVHSKQFRVGKVMETLKKHFTECWELSKSSSPKLEFYHSIKGNFNKEPYLDFCKGFSRRYSTTKLRISAHQLQIEQGRYMNLPREQRTCSWCKTSMGLDVIESENHVLYECDLYSKHRSKLISNLNNIPATPPESDPLVT